MSDYRRVVKDQGARKSEGPVVVAQDGEGPRRNSDWSGDDDRETKNVDSNCFSDCTEKLKVSWFDFHPHTVLSLDLYKMQQKYLITVSMHTIPVWTL